MGLVEDEEDAEVTLVGEATDLLLDGAQRQGAGIGRLEAELETDLAAEVAGIDGGVVEIAGAQALVELVEPGGAEELLLLEATAERGAVEAVEMSVYHFSSSIFLAMRSR